MNETRLNLNSEVEMNRGEFVLGAHASRVQVSASRRNRRSTNFAPPGLPEKMTDESLGATPKLTRRTRVLPFRMNDSNIMFLTRKVHVDLIN